MAIINLLESIAGAQEGSVAQGQQAILELIKTNAAAITPGRVVCRDGHDRKCKVPTTAAEVIDSLGVVLLQDTQILSSNTTGDYPIGTRLSVARKGIVWMLATTACVQGAAVFCYFAGAVAKGKVGGSYVAGETARLPGARFATTQATPGSLVAVEFDLPGDTDEADGASGFGAGAGFVDVVIDLAALAAGTNQISTVVAGSLAGDVFVVTSLTHTVAAAADIASNARCRVAGTVTWSIICTTGTPDPASNTFRFSLVSRG